MVGHEESRLVRWILSLWRSHGRTEGWVGAGDGLGSKGGAGRARAESSAGCRSAPGSSSSGDTSQS